MVDDQTIQELCDRIVRNFQMERIVLFGAYASGNPTLDSEVDLLVVLNFEGKNLWRAVPALHFWLPACIEKFQEFGNIN